MNNEDYCCSLEDTQDYVCSMTPEEFETFCMELLFNYARIENLMDFTIEHNKKIKTQDGTYQIDIYASFTAMGTHIKVLCECKQYKNKIKREQIQILSDKIHSIGVNKGIFLSTSGFQKGAIIYAKRHGIALLQVYDHSCIPMSHSAGPGVKTEGEEDPFIYCENHWPKYHAVLYDAASNKEVTVYPTKEMIEPIFEEMNRIITNWKNNR